MAQHRWRVRVLCRGCGQVGEVEVTEDAGPPFTDTPRRQYLPSKGFLLKETRIYCGGCGAHVPDGRDPSDS